MELQNIQKAIKSKGISKSLPIITSNVNGSNSPIKRRGVGGWIRPNHMLSPNMSLQL